MSGSSVAAPVWLKLERTDGGVYEADDAMNWTKVTKLALALSSLFNLGTTAVVQQNIQTEISEVQLEVSSSEENVLFSEEKPLPKGRISGDFTGSILIANPDYSTGEPCPAASGVCDYVVGVLKGVLKADATLTFKVIKAPETSLKGMTPIGNKIVMELPLDAVNLDDPEPIVAFIAPSFPGAYEDAIGNAFAEISIALSDGREYITMRNYKLGNAIYLQRADIRLALERFDLPLPEILRISVLPTRR